MYVKFLPKKKPKSRCTTCITCILFLNTQKFKQRNKLIKTCEQLKKRKKGRDRIACNLLNIHRINLMNNNHKKILMELP